jgi:hypothetical protein
MISSVDLIKSFNEERLPKFVKSVIQIEELTYEWENYQTDNPKNSTECKDYVYESIILPFIDLDHCIELIKDELEKDKANLYQKNLCIKKQKYFKSVLKVKEIDHVYNLLLKINWYIFKLQDNSEWNEFISQINGEMQIHDVTNTRPLKGFKPNKVSSKIIFNRNGK